MSSAYGITSDNVISSPGILFPSNRILQARFMTLLADHKEEPGLKKQILASGVAQIFSHIRLTCNQIEQFHFYLILVGVDTSGSKGHRDLITNLRNDYFKQTGLGIAQESLLQTEDSLSEIDFFSILSFNDIKSCKNFFYKKSPRLDGKLSESTHRNFVPPSASDNLSSSTEQDSACKLPFDTKDLHLLFLLSENVLRDEYQEQIIFTESLFSNGFDDDVNSKNTIKDDYFQEDSLSILRQRDKNFVCSNPQATIDNYVNIFGINKTDKTNNIEKKVRASIIYMADSVDLGRYPSSDIIIIPQIKSAISEHSDIFIKVSPEDTYSLNAVVNLAGNNYRDIHTMPAADQSIASHEFSDTPHCSEKSDRSETTNQEHGSQGTIGHYTTDSAQHNDPLQGEEINDAVNDRQNIISKPIPETSTINAFAASQAQYSPLYIGLLGPIKIIGSYFNFAHSPRLSELVVYLSLHPEGVSSTTWATALWPDRRVPTQTIANRLSETRRALGIATDDKPRLRKIADKHFIVDTVVDWFLFKNLSADDSALENCREALKLVHGRPLSGIAQGQWISLEGFQTEIEEAIVNCALKVGKWYLEYDDPEHALWAVIQGLKANPFDERLYRLQMYSYDMLGNRVGIEEILMNISSVLEIKGDPLKSIHPKTASLYRVLTGKTS